MILFAVELRRSRKQRLVQSVADVRDLIVTENVTLDGVIDTQRDWFSLSGDDDLAGVTRAHMAAADAVLLGA